MEVKNGPERQTECGSVQEGPQGGPDAEPETETGRPKAGIGEMPVGGAEIGGDMY